MAHRVLMTVLLAAFAIAGCSGGSSNSASNSSTAVPADIQGVMNESLYDGAQWGLQVIDSSDGKVLIDLNSNYQFVVASVRKLFSVGELLDQVGPDHRYNTPVYYSGLIDGSGVLHGNLLLVASGDLTMGGGPIPMAVSRSATTTITRPM
jgi:D-alanyl-D-alanine carboxypeptidase